MIKSYSSKLSLVSHPFTNSEISKKKTRDATKESLSGANIYVLAQVRYPRIFIEKNNSSSSVDITLSNGITKSSGSLDIHYILNANHPNLFKDIANGKYGDVVLSFKVYSNPDCYLVVFLKDKRTKKIVSEALIEITGWQFLFYKSNNQTFIKGFENYIDFFNFKIHYVGKTSKNIFERLSKGHHARGDILSSERVIDNKSILGEELLVLPFKVVKSSKSKSCILSIKEEVDFNEKLLICALQPEYNQIKYDNLIEEFSKNCEFDRYQLHINNGMVLSTSFARFTTKLRYILLDHKEIRIY